MCYSMSGIAVLITLVDWFLASLILLGYYVLIYIYGSHIGESYQPTSTMRWDRGTIEWLNWLLMGFKPASMGEMFEEVPFAGAPSDF